MGGTASSLAKGFAHGPLSLHPWQIELEFVIPADDHLAVFTCPAYKDYITFDQWVLLTVWCLGRCKMAAPSVYIFDCIHGCFRDLLLAAAIDWTQLVVAASNRNRERVILKFQLNLPWVKREGTVSETLG